MSVFKLRFLIVSEIGAPRGSEGFYMGARRDLYRLLKGFCVVFKGWLSKAADMKLDRD